MGIIFNLYSVFLFSNSNLPAIIAEIFGKENKMLHVLEHALIDTLKVLPLLFAAYLLIEYLEHKASGKLISILSRPGAFGPMVGSLIGSVPQCGFSVAAANFFSGRVISMGTLVAVFIATSDEALPILISHPEQFVNLWKMLALKIIIAFAAGMLVDFAYKAKEHHHEEGHIHELCEHEHCDCEHQGVFKSALHHSLHIIIFILIVNIAMGAAVEFIGEENIAKIMLKDSCFQPFVTALIGFIPNCSASVILTELYIGGSVSFGSLIAGLSTGAGVGIAVLFRTNRHIKENLTVVSILYCVSVAAGLIINLIF